MEWICYVTAILFVFDFDDCSAETGVRQGWQWQIGAVSITMCWLNLVRVVILPPKLFLVTF